MPTSSGHRKYLTLAERRAFVIAARRRSPETATFCLTLAHTGARISEILALTPASIDLAAQIIVIESLKKRRTGVYRAVPAPKTLLAMIEAVHSVTDRRLNNRECGQPLWSWGRTTAWTRVKEIMAEIRVPAAVAMPKALRHGFGVASIQAKVPLNMIQKWMGHAKISTTAIYADAVGPEELALASALWLLTE